MSKERVLLRKKVKINTTPEGCQEIGGEWDNRRGLCYATLEIIKTGDGIKKRFVKEDEND